MIGKVFRQMSAAQIVSAMTFNICLLVDSAVVGRLLGVDAMSASGLTRPLLIVFFSLATTISCGIQVVCGKALGMGEGEQMNQCYSTSVVMALCVAGAGILLVFTAAQPLCVLLGAGRPGADNVVLTMTGDYLRGFFLGAPFYYLSQLTIPYLQIMGKRRLLLLSVAAMTVSDIVMDLLSVYVFHAGMFGIGMASSLSYLSAIAVSAFYFLNRDCPFRFRWSSVSWSTALAIGKSGSTVVFNQLMYTLRIFCFNRMMLSLAGTLGVAALALITTLADLLYCIAVGSGSVTLMLSSMFYAEEDRHSLEELVQVMTSRTLALMAAGVALFEVGARWLMVLFLGDKPEVLAVAVPGLRLYLFSLLFSVLNALFKNYFQGVRHMKLNYLIAFLESVGSTSLFAFLISRVFGLTGLWIGVSVGQMVTFLGVSALMWQKYGRVSFTREAYSYLSRDFGASASDCMDLSIEDGDSAMAASQQVYDFCCKHASGQRTAMLLSLCVEEIANNILRHGFHSDKRAHHLDIRLVAREEDWVLRFRDDCVHFDPLNYLQLHREEDPASHIGLRMVMGMAAEANYVNSLGLNHLTLTVAERAAGD